MKNKCEIEGDTAVIYVKEHRVLVDADVLPGLKSISVNYWRDADQYAKRHDYPLIQTWCPKAQKTVRLATYLYPDCPKHMVRDHIDGNVFDMRRRNIRYVTRRENAINNYRRRAGFKIHGTGASKVFSFRVPREDWDEFVSLFEDGDNKYEIIKNALEAARAQSPGL